MKNYIERAKTLAFSSTAKDTYILFFGNTLAAFLGFVYIIFVSNVLSKESFGVFSAATNLVVLLISLTDVGLSTTVVNFVAEYISKNDYLNSNKFVKAAVFLRLILAIIVSLFVIVFAKFVATNFLSTENYMVSVWTGIITLSLALPMILPFVLQGQRRYIASSVADNSVYLSRLIFTLLFMFVTSITLENSLIAFAIGGFIGSLVGLFLVGGKFIYAKPENKDYLKLIKFTGWLSVNRVLSSIFGRLDVQMLIMLSGPLSTASYSLASRFAGLVNVFSGSFSAVLAPRLASFNDKDEVKKYLVKATIGSAAISLFLVFASFFVEPFFYLVWKEKYLDSVPILKTLLFINIPFILSTPSVSAIIYSMKKTVFIGLFSFIQFAIILISNLLLIPIYGAIAPAYTLGISYIVLAIYSWSIVFRHYWLDK